MTKKILDFWNKNKKISAFIALVAFISGVWLVVFPIIHLCMGHKPKFFTENQFIQWYNPKSIPIFEYVYNKGYFDTKTEESDVIINRVKWNFLSKNLFKVLNMNQTSVSLDEIKMYLAEEIFNDPWNTKGVSCNLYFLAHNGLFSLVDIKYTKNGEEFETRDFVLFKDIDSDYPSLLVKDRNVSDADIQEYSKTEIEYLNRNLFYIKKQGTTTCNLPKIRTSPDAF